MRFACVITVCLSLFPRDAVAQEWSADDVFGEPQYLSQPIPLIPGVPAPPNYFGVAGNSYQDGYTVIETETTKIDPFKAATGFMHPTYTERRIQVVPNNSMGQPIVPFRLAP